MNITFRLETPADQTAVEAMTREAFWRFWEDDRKVCDEHLLVHKLRTAQGFVPELNTVAEIDGKLAGHIIFTKSRVADETGKVHETLTFGPLTVLPDMQSKGVGRALMRHTFEKAKQLGYRAVIIFGHADYYPRAGFKRAAEFGITDENGKTFDALMVCPLVEGALDGIQGKYHIDPVYHQLNQEDALTFDQKFPPKTPYVPAPISVLLNRLEPEAAKAIQSQDFKTIDVIRSRSEREIASIPGMDAKAVETVRAVMREHGCRWGEKQ